MYTKWVTKCTRPVSLSQDPDFKLYIRSISGGKYLPPAIPTVQKCIVEIAAASMKMLKVEIEALTNEGILPSVAADIWGENGKSLFGLLLYYITPDFVFKEKVCWPLLACCHSTFFLVFFSILIFFVFCSWLQQNLTVLWTMLVSR
jgi:hypothetical protein